MKEFRFGLHAFALSGHDEWVALARQAETSGFSVLTVPDHLIDGCISPFAALGVVAEATSTLRVGTLVLNNDLRHPALVAREALALDSLSEGRVELGLGAGSAMSSPEYESVGMRFDDGATRVARLAEAVEVLDGLLRGNHVVFSGEHYRLGDHRPWPPATQRPRPPILVGGSGRRLLRIAAERADIVSLSGIDPTRSGSRTPGTAGFLPEAVDERVALIRAASGDGASNFRRSSTSDRDRRSPRCSRAGPRVPARAERPFLGTPYLWIGTTESICQGLLAARERWGISYFTVFNDALEAVTPIVNRLAGT